MTDMTYDLTDLTHEELATEATRVGRVTNDPALVDIASQLQAAVDAETDSAAIAADVIARIEED